jgi:hypothetical protein
MIPNRDQLETGTELSYFILEGPQQDENRIHML